MTAADFLRLDRSERRTRLDEWARSGLASGRNPADVDAVLNELGRQGPEERSLSCAITIYLSLRQALLLAERSLDESLGAQP